MHQTIQKYDFQAGWKEIEPVIQKLNKILDQQSGNNNNSEEKLMITKIEYSNTYTLIYNLCLEKDSNNSEQLYEQYKKQIQSFVKDKIFNSVKGLKGEELLNKIIQKWDIYQIFLRFMTRFFSYLDKSYIEHNNLQKLKQIGYYLYLKQVHDHLKDNIILAFQQEIEKDRNNYKSDLDMLRKISEIFVEINKSDNKDENYQNLGKNILSHAKAYYESKFQEWSESCSCEEYISNIILVQKEENRRFEKCFTKFTDTQKQISQLFNEEMVLKYRSILLTKDHGFTFMLENNKSHVLQQIYQLYKNLNDNFEELRQTFGEWVFRIGSNIFEEKIKSNIEDKPDQKKKKYATDHEFVERLFNEYKEMNNMIVQNFNSDANFYMSFKSALDRFLNVPIDDYGLPELLANYTDYILKKENLKQEELDQKLNQIIEIFNHLTEKDIYLTLYQKQLATRLLKAELKAGSRYDDESLMITKIKGCCGQGQETKNYEGMISDIKYTMDLKKNFDEYMNQKIKVVDLNVKVLQEANWPSYKSTTEIILPLLYENLKEEFKKFYQIQKKSQKLNWINTLGSFDIKMNITFEKSNFFLVNVSPIQLCILLQFEKVDNWIPISTILSTIGIKKENIAEFNKEIAQLIGKKILLTSKSQTQKQEEKKDEADEVSFKFNQQFSYQKKKFSVVPEESQQKFKRDVVNENREHVIEATIVRIMKSRKTMKYTELISEVNVLLRKFQTQPHQIKKRIESLVEREYIERDKTDMNLYHYKQ
ncbi:hypothetical protein ABPG74_022435 [Tetrahymena malaccensis]